MKAADLEYCDRWWRGFKFLQQPENTWSTNGIDEKHACCDELKRPVRLQKEKFRLECLGMAAVCYCGTPWTFLLPFVQTEQTGVASMFLLLSLIMK